MKIMFKLPMIFKIFKLDYQIIILINIDNNVLLTKDKSTYKKGANEANVPFNFFNSLL